MLLPVPDYHNYLGLAWSPFFYKDLVPQNYTGILPTFPEHVSFPDRSKVIFKWYPTTHKTTYVAQSANKLFYPGGSFVDDLRINDKYKQLFMLLDKTGYLDIYLSKSDWPELTRSRQQPLPLDGVSILNAAKRDGVSLVLHARDHLKNSIPTDRIFEAAAANTVIIFEQNPFVIDTFGDNVIYIDDNQDAENIFK